MTFRIAMLAGLTTLATAGGCADIVDDPDPDQDVTAAAREEIKLPDVVRYKPGDVDGRTLVPDDAGYIHLTYTVGPGKSCYVWGIADGRVRYIYQVFSDDDDDHLTHQFLLTVREREAIGAVRGHSIAGVTKPGHDNPPPPTPVGEPPFSQEYAGAVVTAATTTQAATEVMLDAIK